MQAMKQLLAAILLLFLTGCGDIEWLPDASKNRVDAGGFVSSARQGSEERFTTVTGRGVFHTYTSLRIPAGTPVVLEQNITNGAVSGRILIGQDQLALVSDVVNLAE